MTNLEKSINHYKRACESIPRGLTSNFRKDDGTPIFFSHGNGGRLFDLDGNTYIDYSLSYGPSILGHNPSAGREMLAAQLDRMFTNENNIHEAEAAELICKHVPSADKVFFCLSGSEAIANALRVARTYTSRNFILRFRGHYHGSGDAVLGGYATDAGAPIVQSGYLDSDPYSKQFNTGGRASHALNDSLMIEWNDIESLKALLRKMGDQIAAILMEPIAINCFGCRALPGYLESVRDLCDEYRIVLIFDEIITGFRSAIGGAQSTLGITPDLTTFAKAIGGGLAPVSALCGRSDVMDVITRKEAVCAGTYNGHPLSMAAIKATITALEKDDRRCHKTIADLSDKFSNGLSYIFSKNEIPIVIQGMPGAICIAWSDREKLINFQDAMDNGNWSPFIDKLIRSLRENFILTHGRFYISAAHTDEDIRNTLRIVEECCEKIKSSDN